MKTKTTFIALSVCYFFLYSIICSAEKRLPVELTAQQNELINKYHTKVDEFTNRGDLKEASRFLNLISTMYWEAFQYEKALEFTFKSLKLNETLDNENGESMLFNNIAMIYSDLEEYEKSYEYFDKTLIYRRKSKDKVGIIAALINQSVILTHLKNYPLVVTKLEEAAGIAREINDLEQMRLTYGMLSEIYEKIGDASKAQYYYNFYKSFNELINKEKVNKAMQTAEKAQIKNLELEIEKKNQTLELLKKEREVQAQQTEITQEKQKNISLYKDLTRNEIALKLAKKEAEYEKLTSFQHKQQLEQERLFNIISMCVIVVFISLSLYLIYLFYQKRKANKLLSTQNNQITEQKLIIEKKNTQIYDSIQYAKRIQTAMLNREISLNDIIKESFIFFQPKDIVSGDFYWYTKKDDTVLVVAADCTGHGVPGAFMSMIGTNLLNQIIDHENILQPSKILKRLDELIISALHQNHSENKDGMDMVVVSFDTNTKKLLFSGAKNPIVIIKNNELQHIKGSKCPVGGDYMEKFFEENEYLVDSDTYVYLFSDGFEDQFGGPTNSKFMVKRLKETLLNNHKSKMNVQHDVLKTTINDWKGSEKQIDDMLVVGMLLN